MPLREKPHQFCENSCHVCDKSGHGGEIQLTDALVELLKSENFHVIDSESIHFDVGSKEGYNDANNYLSQL